MPKWEYLFVVAKTEASVPTPPSLMQPWLVNGHELPDWQQGPPLAEFAAVLGGQGWEVVTVQPVSAVVVELVFKRPAQLDPRAAPRRAPRRKAEGQ